MNSDHVKEFRTQLEAAVDRFGVDALTAQQADQLSEHYAMLCKWNQRMNLTRISGAEEAAKLHYAESLYGSRYILAEQTVLDIGSGAGFPSIPLAVTRPDLRITALEANHKKSLFLLEAKDALRLGNLEIVNARLEQFDWSGFELLTSRALEKATTVFQSVIKRMNLKQRLMLYCARDLIATLERQVGGSCAVETHPIPLSKSRVIGVLAR
ncbi:MAG: 16S rRNA (guanine(527)-N(7))-methyltransferase RsmG [Blastocatellia bacterium]